MTKKPAKDLPPRVWIELQPPRDKAHADRICELANNMLKRLAAPGDPPGSEFWWSVNEQRYCFGGNHGYMTLSDRGEWFNLEYFGRPLEAATAEI
jgi:hypothetical protein